MPPAVNGKMKDEEVGDESAQIAAGLAATLLFRGFSYWLLMAPGILLARRETRA
jgi:hypothetical protein